MSDSLSPVAVALRASEHAVWALRELAKDAPSRDLSVAIQYQETSQLWLFKATVKEPKDACEGGR